MWWDHKACPCWQRHQRHQNYCTCERLQWNSGMCWSRFFGWNSDASVWLIDLSPTSRAGSVWCCQRFTQVDWLVSGFPRPKWILVGRLATCFWTLDIWFLSTCVGIKYYISKIDWLVLAYLLMCWVLPLLIMLLIAICMLFCRSDLDAITGDIFLFLGITAEELGTFVVSRSPDFGCLSMLLLMFQNADR